jgi:hypothetical protein
MVKAIPGQARKPFGFPPESLFTFSQESFSPSPRNRFHVHPGIAFTLARNPQWARRITASVFIVIGARLSLNYIFEVQI